MNSEKKLSSTVVIFDVSNELFGKLVSFQLKLKPWKKLSPTVHDILEISNELSGNLVNFQ